MKNEYNRRVSNNGEVDHRSRPDVKKTSKKNIKNVKEV